MKFYKEKALRNWEFGIGYYQGNWKKEFFSIYKEYCPTEIYLLIGPYTFGIRFGQPIMIREDNVPNKL